jgi:type IV secretion system protein VirB10
VKLFRTRFGAGRLDSSAGQGGGGLGGTSEQDAGGPAHGEAEDQIQGERTVSSLSRARSMQSRVSSVLAVGLMSALGLGLLTWYYANVLSRQSRAGQSAQLAAKNRAQGEMALPPLGRINPPLNSRGTGIAEQLLGPPPVMPNLAGTAAWSPADLPAQGPPPANGPPPRAHETSLDRRLHGRVFAKQSGSRLDAQGEEPQAAAAVPVANYEGATPFDEPDTGSRSTGSSPSLAGLLRPSVTPAARATVLPTRRFLLSKGAFIDCTLETAIDSTLPGMTTCITATDTFSVDGKVVLLERGTKLVGETRGQVQQGSSRLFVLWTEARTPTGVVVPLASPGTDELGRSGLSGEVNRHFWQRFGAAILVTVIDGAVQSAVERSSGSGGTIVLNPSTTTDVMTEVLKSTIAIPPTVRKQQGDRIQILVARDLDFRSVYELRNVSAKSASSGEVR